MLKDEQFDKKLPNPKPQIYATIYHSLALLVQKLGYSLCVHGSMIHDLDLVAYPSRKGAVPTDTLATAVWEELSKYNYGGKHFDVNNKTYRMSGRVAYIIPIINDWYIDFHVFPPLEEDKMVIYDSKNFYWRTRGTPSDGEIVLVEKDNGPNKKFIIVKFINEKWRVYINSNLTGEEIPEEVINRWTKIPD